MTGPLALMIMDVVVMVLLAAVLFFAIRLQAQLMNFRAERLGFEKLLRDLGANIAHAEKAIQGLRDTARASGRDLQAQIDSARALSDELQIISEAGDNLASRLERSAEGNGGAVGGRNAGFAIRDPEAEKDGNDDGLFADDSDGEKFHTRAEKELYEALRGGRKTGAGRP
jgi:hypothetical protein